MDASRSSVQSLQSENEQPGEVHTVLPGVTFTVVEEFEFEKPDYTEEEVASLWYTMEELVGLVRYELQICEENNKKERRCWRGLEHMKGGVDNRQERVAEAIDGILNAYDELYFDSDQQTTEAGEREEALRAECRARTRDDRKRAYKFGLRDEVVVEEIAKEAAKRKSRSRHSRSSNNSNSSKSKEQGKSSRHSAGGRKSSPREIKRRVKRTRSNSREEARKVKSHSPERERLAMKQQSLVTANA